MVGQGSGAQVHGAASVERAAALAPAVVGVGQGAGTGLLAIIYVLDTTPEVAGHRVFHKTLHNITAQAKGSNSSYL